MASNKITVQENRSVTLPSEHNSFAMDRREWNRLKETVNSCKMIGQWFMSVAFCFFGIAGSAGITWISLLSSQSVEKIRLVLLIVAIASVIIGILCLWFQFSENKNQTTSIQSIKNEIKYIEEGIPSEAS